MPSRDAAFHAIVDAFALEGCPVCRVVNASTMRYFDALIHENVNDVDFRAELRAARGFCRLHAWTLGHRVRGAALGAAIMYRDVLNVLNEDLSAFGHDASRHGKSARASGLLSRRKPGEVVRKGCPACTLAIREEFMYVGVVLEHIADEAFVLQYEMSSGVCFPHMGSMLRRAKGGARVQHFVAAHQRIVRRLIAELDTFQQKSDYRFAHESLGTTADSWRRAIELAVGQGVTQEPN